MQAVAAKLAAKGVLVRCAYLELEEPALAGAADEVMHAGARIVTIVPMFLGTGRHAREDLPALVAQLRAAHHNVAFRLQAAVGEDERVLELLASIALE